MTRKRVDISKVHRRHCTAADAGAALLVFAVVGIAALCFVFWLMTRPAHAHDWYPPLCCSGGDCAPLASSRVRPEGAGGYVVDGKFHVIRKDVQDSPDGQYHACFPTSERMACFWAPPAAI